MEHMPSALIPRAALITIGLFLAAVAFPSVPAAAPVPDKLVVLTFDDSSASHHAIAAPLLKRYGFGATFFITEGFTFRTNKRDYMTWEQIAELHRGAAISWGARRRTSVGQHPAGTF